VKQLSKHELNKLTAKELKEKIPFQVTVDNEVIAVVLPMKDVHLLQQSPKATPKNKQLPSRELPLSKHRQAQNLLPRNY
jgi:hypothetical protein